MNTNETSEVKSVVEDAGQIAKDVAAKNYSNISVDLSKAVQDVQIALPVIKEGYKTSEFWVVVGAIAVIVGFATSGHPIPIETDVAIGGVAAIYTAIRGFIKVKAIAAAPLVSVVTPPAAK